MRESGVGRVLVASLHQAIADTLPGRLAFYESWLSPEGLRDGTIGLAPLYAVLSFLRQEGEAYDVVTATAGAYAAEWTVASMKPLVRRSIGWLPRRLQRRVLLGRASALIQMSYVHSRASWNIRRGAAKVHLTGSVFCDVREPVGHPLCGFHAAVFERMLTLFSHTTSVAIVSCRGAGDPECELSVPFGAVKARADEPEVA
jgi:hypothetical protein